VEQAARPPHACANGMPARSAARRIVSPGPHGTSRWSGRTRMVGTVLHHSGELRGQLSISRQSRASPPTAAATDLQPSRAG
jgi:hypothetical protein